MEQIITQFFLEGENPTLKPECVIEKIKSLKVKLKYTATAFE